jgi:hypothetical protein
MHAVPRSLKNDRGEDRDVKLKMRVGAMMDENRFKGKQTMWFEAIEILRLIRIILVHKSQLANEKTKRK